MAEAIPTKDIKFVAAILYRVYSRISYLAPSTSHLSPRISHLASLTSHLAPSP